MNPLDGLFEIFPGKRGPQHIVPTDNFVPGTAEQLRLQWAVEPPAQAAQVDVRVRIVEAVKKNALLRGGEGVGIAGRRVRALGEARQCLHIVLQPALYGGFVLVVAAEFHDCAQAACCHEAVDIEQVLTLLPRVPAIAGSLRRGPPLEGAPESTLDLAQVVEGQLRLWSLLLQALIQQTVAQAVSRNGTQLALHGRDRRGRTLLQNKKQKHWEDSGEPTH